MQAYTVVANTRYGRHGAPQRWFKTKKEAELFALDLMLRSQIGRNTRMGSSTSELKLYVVKGESVVTLPSQRIRSRPLQKDDVDSILMQASRV